MGLGASANSYLLGAVTVLEDFTTVFTFISGMAAIGPRRIFQTGDAVMAQKTRVMVVIERRDSSPLGKSRPRWKRRLGYKGR